MIITTNMANVPIQTLRLGGGLFSKIWRFKFAFFFFLYILISIIVIGIYQKDVNLVIEKLGNEFFNPIVSANDYISNVQNGQGIFKNIWNYWGIYFQLYKLYLWIKILTLIWGASPFSNTSELFKNLGMGLITFYVLNVLYVVIFMKENPILPFTATWDIVLGLTQLIVNINVPSTTIEANNTCTNGFCVI